MTCAPCAFTGLWTGPLEYGHALHALNPQGSGSGRALSRQIAENHGGTLTLENRAEAQGCVARLRLPV